MVPTGRVLKGRDDDAARRNIVAAIQRRKEAFALASLTWSADGYTVIFSQGPLSVRKAGIDESVLEDVSSARMDKLLDEVRREFGGPEP